MSRSKPIIVTGAAGFIGSALISQLNSIGIVDILAVDCLDSGLKWKNLVKLKFNDYMEGAELRSSIEKKTNFLKDYSIMYHLGACSTTTEQNSAYLMDNNFGFTKLCAVNALSSGCKFVYASSAATYGDGANGMSDDHREIDKFRPLNMYAYSKHLFDLFALRKGFLPKVVGLKYFNVFGPNEYHKNEMVSVVYKSYHDVNAGKPIKLFKSQDSNYSHGDQARDFIYVKDAVKMTLFLGANTNASGLYNIGSGAATTWNTLAKSVFKAMNSPINIEYIDMPTKLSRNYQYFTKANISKIMKLGYDHQITPIGDAVCDYIKNYLTHGNYF